MKSMFLAFTFAALFCGAAYSQSVPERRQNQQQRIGRGVENGSLTHGETARLERQQRSIRKQVRRDRNDGAGYTAKERAKTQSRLNNASRDINRLKHNGRVR